MPVVSILSERLILIVSFIAATALLSANRYVFVRERRLFLQLLGMIFLFSLAAVTELALRGAAVFSPLHLLLSAAVYGMKPFIALLFLEAVTEKNDVRPWLWAIPSLSALLALSSFASQWIPGFPLLAFRYTEDNALVCGPLYYASFALSSLLLVAVLANALYRRKKRPRSFLIMTVFIVAANAAAAVLELAEKDTLLFPEIMILSLFFYYTMLCIHYMQKHEKEVIHQNQIDLLVSQIQPHFLYNTLNSIYHLCDSDPERAKKTIDDFSTYLRANLNSMTQPAPISFEKELEHTKTYIDIEKLRFGDRIRAVFDLPVTDFLLPPLSLQPLVENAIKHGLCQKEEGGTVTVMTRQDGDDVVLTVSDDGVGFDTAALSSLPPSHVGYNNVKTRLMRMLGGSLQTESAPGMGCTVTVRVKKHDSNSGR